MKTNALFILAAIPAILYNNASLNRLYETYVKLGMNIQELSEILHIEFDLVKSSESDVEGTTEVFEYESSDLKKYIMIFKNGRLNKWYTELKSSF